MDRVTIQYQYDVGSLGEVSQDAYEAALRLELAEQFPGAQIDIAKGPGKTALVAVDDDHLSNQEIASLVRETQEHVREVAQMVWTQLATGEEWVPWP